MDNVSPFTVAWSKLKTDSGGAAGEISAAPLDGTRTANGMLRAYLGEGEILGALLPIAINTEIPKVKLVSDIELKERNLVLEGQNHRFISLLNKNKDLDHVFARVCDQIAEETVKSGNVLKALVTTIEKFQKLFRSAKTEVSQEKAAGLAGELIVLRELLNINGSSESFWTGPDGQRHDFSFPSVAFEVKTTTRVQNTKVEISSLDQLLEPENGVLYLIHVSLEKNPGGDYTIPRLVEEISPKVTDQESFIEKLANLGYSDELREKWESFKFTWVRRRLFAVKDGFPRLVPADFEVHTLPQGVSDLKYSVDLASASTFQKSDKDAESILNSLKGVNP